MVGDPRFAVGDGRDLVEDVLDRVLLRLLDALWSSFRAFGSSAYSAKTSSIVTWAYQVSSTVMSAKRARVVR